MQAYKSEAEHGPAPEVPLRDILAYGLPRLRHPEKWPYATELEPKAQPHKNDFLVFAYWGLDNDEYLEPWKRLPAQKGEEVNDNLILWQQLLADEK